MERQGISQAELARRLSCNRSKVCKLLNKSYISTDELLRISRILDFDFFALYSAEL